MIHSLTTRIRPLYLSALLLLLTPFATGETAVQISNPAGELREADPELIWVQTMDGRNYNEFWNYQFYFDNGIRLHLIYNLANFGGLKSPVSGVRVSIYYPDGEVKQVAREFPIERLLQDKDIHRVWLQPGKDLYFEGELPHEHRVVMRTSKDGDDFDIDLRFRNIEQGYMWGDGTFNVHDEQIGIVTHIPYARVSGHIVVNDRRERVSGTGYMDHTFQNQTTSRLVTSGFRFVNHRDRNNWEILYALRPRNNPDDRMIGYRLRKVNGEVELIGADRFYGADRGRAFGRRVSNNVRIGMEDGSEILLKREKDQEIYALFRELGWLARQGARTFLGGEVVDFRGNGVLEQSSGNSIRGHYNFFVID